MEFVFIFLATIVVFYLTITRTKKALRSHNDKKEDITIRYEEDLKTILKNCENDKKKQLEEKKIFLKNCNDELSRNIFFKPEEASKVLQRLAKL